MSKAQTGAKIQSFIDEVAALPGGVNIRSCMQCGACSGSCPAAEVMEYGPRTLITMVRAGMRDDVLKSSSMWRCQSCYLCTVRCPQDVRPADVIHALETLAHKEGKASAETATPRMYEAFVDRVKKNGRVHELGFMINYYLSSPTLPLDALSQLSSALSLFEHRRMPLMPYRIKAKSDLNAILKKARELKGDAK